MLVLKAFHLVFVVTWFAGLFYLPRLFVYHAMSGEADTIATLKVMQRKLMVMTHIGGALTWLFGLLILMHTPQLLAFGWLQVKLVLVLALSAYHLWCFLLVRRLAAGAGTHSHRWYRWFNEIPTVLLIAIVVLAVVKPF